MKYVICGENIDVTITKKLEIFELDEMNPDIVFSFGGDGTMLHSIAKYRNHNEVLFVGINTGKLGFYTDFVIEEIDLIIQLFQNKKFDIASFPLLEYEIKTKTSFHHGFALNDISLINPIHTLIIDVSINNQFFEHFRGTGLLLSSPSGSTAYNKAVGGSIIEPSLKAFQLTEVASINNRVFSTISAPLVLGEETSVTLYPEKQKDLYVAIDGRHEQMKEEIEQLTCRLSKKEVQFLIKPHTTFFDRIKRAFLE